MPLSEHDPAYLWDMREAALHILDFIRGVSFSKYSANKMIQSAVERQLEILGEAARRVSPEYQEEHPEIAWRSIIGLRNILAHEYGEVKADRIWRIASVDAADIIRQLDPLIPPIDE